MLSCSGGEIVLMSNSYKNSLKLSYYFVLIPRPAADPEEGGGQGGHAPPVPVKTSHKKYGRHRRPLIFHVSWPLPSDHPGSDAADCHVIVFSSMTV